MIRSFHCKDTEDLFLSGKSRRWSLIRNAALRKLDQLHAVPELAELKEPPGNRLEPLRGAREGQHSIRINDQWRLCFRWEDKSAYEVEIVDYH